MLGCLLPWPDSNPRPPQECDALAILASRHTVYINSITEAVLTVLPWRASLSLQLCLMFRSFCCDCIATIRPSIPTTSLGLALLPIHVLYVAII